jgi:hypothetical protein
MSEDAALAGLVRLWHRCWSDEIDILTGDEVAGAFAFDASSPNGSARAIGALVAFGFLEPKGEGWRVRGASRYLRLKESRRRGAALTNVKIAEKKLALAANPANAPERSKSERSESGALECMGAYAPERSSTESPSHREKAIAAQAATEPKQPRKPSAQQAFFRWTQEQAQEAFPTRINEREPNPTTINAQLKAPMSDIGRVGLEAAWRVFMLDRYAVDRGLPWGLFVSKIPELHNRMPSQSQPQPMEHLG